MANKSLIPAFKAHVGDWAYFMAVMKYAEVDRTIKFAHEMPGGHTDLGKLIQRGLTKRTEEIRDYLLGSEHRFLGAMIIAAWGGSPSYQSVNISDPSGTIEGLDDNFGFLTFDGTQQYFALDGQHRLRAIKDALKENIGLAGEEICVLIVDHYDTDDGRQRTRRLFTNINRNAKPTSASENIALEEDDGYAIIGLDHRFANRPRWMPLHASPASIFTSLA